MGVSGISPVAQFNSAQKDEATAASNYIKTNSTAQRELTSFQKNASKITTTDQLMKDYSSNKVVLSAYNLGSVITQPALEKKLLTQDPSSNSSLAKTAGNASWLAFADAFSSLGAGNGTAATTPFTSDSINLTSSAYQLQQYEQSDSLQKTGVGDALYFARTMQSGKIKNVNNLMSDKTLLKVAQVVNGYDPDQFGALDFSQQQRIMNNKVDLSKLSTPEQINKFAQQYLVQLQIHPEYNKPDKPASMMDLFGASSDGDSIVSLFGGSSDDDYSTQLASLF